MWVCFNPELSSQARAADQRQLGERGDTGTGHIPAWPGPTSGMLLAGLKAIP